MPKERLYVHDSGEEPSPVTPAQRAFFRWRYTAGSFEYARKHGSVTEALSQELAERYDAYRELRDHAAELCSARNPKSPHDSPQPHLLRENPPFQPNELPPELAAFLQGKDYACLIWGTDQGSVFVTKAPARDIQSLRGNVPVRITHELYQHPRAPVIRTAIRWYDQPEHPLAMETYTNIGDEQQRADFLDLAQQDELRFLFYDRALRHRLSKVVRNRDRGTIGQIAATADQLRVRIPRAQYDFDAAKRDVMKRTSL